MIIIENVQGTQETVPSLEINVDTVYIRSNIKRKIDSEEHPYWEYDEKQLTIEEYLKEVVPLNQQLTDMAIAELTELFASYQQQTDKAIAELSMAITGGVNNV